MTRLPKILLGLGILAGSATLHAGDAVTVLGKTWTVGYTAQDGQQQLTEFVLPGETVENWSALVTRSLVLFDTRRSVEYQEPRAA